ncbi:MAG: hypothetical protein Q9181_005747 [Wetmoreana brouardii]
MLVASLRHAASSRNTLGRVASYFHKQEWSRLSEVSSFPGRRLSQAQVSTGHNAPFRKQSKDEAKERKLARKNDSTETNEAIDYAALDRWELTGFQKGALLPAIRAALALRCRVQNRSQFDRKHYFYADQPAGYQITQYYQPFATDGTIVLHDHDGIAAADGHSVAIGIKQVQLEQDTAKTVLQPPSEALLDFNRVGHPLIEIITLPQIHQPQTAAACVKKIQAVLQAVNAVTTGMELGGLRADVNVSVRRKDIDAGLGQRTEIKNLNSIKAVEDAIIAERNRQITVLENGGTIQGETRGWALGASDTVKLRGKEGEVDYRYMPDPDLGPLIVSNHLLDSIAEELPQLPDDTINDLVENHGLTLKDAKTLVALEDGERLDYYDHARQEFRALRSKAGNPAQGGEGHYSVYDVKIANWVLHEIGGLLSTSETAFSPSLVPASDLAYIILTLEMDNITGRTAKQLLAKKFLGDARSIETIIEEENLALVHLSDEEYIAMARDLIHSNPVIVAQIREQRQLGRLGFLMGQMMRKGKGKIVAQKAEDTLRELLGIPQYLLGFGVIVLPIIPSWTMTSPSTIQPQFLSSENQLGVVAVGFSGGQCKPGVDAAPSALISAGLLTQLKEELGYELFHDGTVHSYSSIMPDSDPDYRNMKKPLAVSAVTRQLSQQVYEHARQGRCVLTLGGDHSIAIGTISGTARAVKERLGREMAVIWVDAHADINTPEISGSGNVHGMPVAFLTGLAEEKREEVFGWLKQEQRISLKKLVYIGLRDVDRGEKKILRDNGIKAFSMHDIDRHGIGRVMEMALAHIGTDTPIHLSFDVDALDPQWAPSTGTPVRGGLTLREGDYIAECVHETGSLVAMDLVEVNPSLEAVGAAETIRAGCSLVRCALGDTLL